MGLLNRLRSRAPGPGAPDPQATEQVRAELRAVLVAQSAGTLTDDSIDPAAPLLQFGYLDSLSAVNFVEQVRVRYGVELSEDDLVGELSTLGAVARFVAERRARTR